MNDQHSGNYLETTLPWRAVRTLPIFNINARQTAVKEPVTGGQPARPSLRMARDPTGAVPLHFRKANWLGMPVGLPQMTGAGLHRRNLPLAVQN